jgi:hypothetical protein
VGVSKYEDEARDRGVPEDWVAFFGRLWRDLEEGEREPFELQPPPDAEKSRFLSLDEDDVRVRRASETTPGPIGRSTRPWSPPRGPRSA